MNICIYIIDFIQHKQQDAIKYEMFKSLQN